MNEIILTIAGIGTYLAKDDEIGLALVNALSTSSLPDNIQLLLWESVDALSLAHDLLELENPLLIVDCADMSTLPGRWQLFSNDDTKLKVKLHNISTHGFGFAEGLSIAQALGHTQPVYIFGIQPFDLSPRPELSPEMKKLFPTLLTELTNSINELVQTILENNK